MRLPLVLLASFLASLHSAQAAECTIPIQKRWEEAMREITQVERLPWRERADENNIAVQCRMMTALVEVSAAAKEYFPVCDPILAGRGHVALKHSEDALAKFDVSKCAKSPAASAGKKKERPASGRS